MNQRRSSGDDPFRTPDLADAEVNERNLLRQTARGDEVAFNELYQRYQRPLFNYLLRLVQEQEAAEELLQEVFVAVWTGAGRFEGRSKLRTWLYRIAHNQAISWLRRHLRTAELTRELVTLESAPETGAGGPDPERQAIRSWQMDRILEAMAELSPHHRAVIELTFVQSFSYREIAEVLDCPVGTVKSRMSHAMRQLNRLLSREGVK